MRSEISKLAFALANDTLGAEFSKEKAENVIREKINEACGGEFNYYNFMDNKYKVFAIMAETLEVATNYIKGDAFDVLVEYKDVTEGDELNFKVEDPSLFTVSQTAIGTNDIMRQRLSGKRIPTVQFNLAVKIYEELKLFMAGKVDFGKAVTKVAASFNAQVANIIAKAMYNSYTDLAAPYLVTGAYDRAKLIGLVAELELDGKNPVIMGSKKALGHLVADLVDAPEKVKEQVWSNGYIGQFFGCPVVSLPNARNNDGTKVIDDNTIIVIPQGEKPVKFGYVGEALVVDSNDGTQGTLQQVEFTMQRGAVMAVIAYRNYGMYRITE